MSMYREKDLEAWRQWNMTKSDADLEALFSQVDGVINKEINRWSGVLARPVLELEARKIAIDAFKSFDPNQGVALSTYLTNMLKKLSRITYKHQNLSYIPENSVLKIGTFDNAIRDLEDLHGREPTSEELGDYLAWSPGAVEKMRKVRRTEFIASGDLPTDLFSGVSQGGVVDYVYHDLNPTQKVIFEHSTGYGGAPVLPTPEVLKKLKISQGVYSYEKKKMIDQIQGLTGGFS